MNRHQIQLIKEDVVHGEALGAAVARNVAEAARLVAKITAKAEKIDLAAVRTFNVLHPDTIDARERDAKLRHGDGRADGDFNPLNS